MVCLKLDIFIVDTFTDELFKGNPAAVVPVEDWPTNEVMQNIAFENNVSETAFIKKISHNLFYIRWFSPTIEVHFCGHATLAASFVLYHFYGCDGLIEYETAEVGLLSVIRLEDGRIQMNLPRQEAKPVDTVPVQLLAGLSIVPQAVLRNPVAYIVVLANEQQVFDMVVDIEQLRQLAPFDVAVTALSTRYDFVSRYFWPANGGIEDPVTGSVHAGLVPYWGRVLGKPAMIAYQASERTGVLYCGLTADRVLVSGFSKLYLQGHIVI